MTKKTMIVLLVSVGGLTGCLMGRAEMVKRDRAGGVLALKGDRDKAMQDAEKQMAANCSDGYEIVGEEMAKVGEATDSEEDTAIDIEGASKSGSSVTRDVTEYRITYECKSAEAQTVAAQEEEAVDSEEAIPEETAEADTEADSEAEEPAEDAVAAE